MPSITLPQNLVFDVLDYGAKGDGVTDDTGAITAAIAACPAGGIVYFPSPPLGYLVSGSGTEILLVTKNISLIGAHGQLSAITVPSTTPTTTDVIRVAVPGEAFFQRIENIAVLPLATGSTVTITGSPTGGTFVLSDNPGLSESSSPIAHNASATAFLLALPPLLSAAIAGVTGSAGGPYTISWLPGLSPVAITLGTNSLTGGTAPSVAIVSGLVAAQNCLTIDVTAGAASQSNMNIAGNFFGACAGYSISLTNPSNTNGFFCSQIDKNLILSGISLIRNGDSNIISRNTFGHVAGSYLGTDRPAITMSTVPGAARNAIIYNNSSANGGFFRGLSGTQTIIRGNQCEQGPGTPMPEGGLISISGSTASMDAVRVVENNVNTHGLCSYAILIDHATNAFIEGNVCNGSPIQITANATQVYVGPNATDMATVNLAASTQLITDGAGNFSIGGTVFQAVGYQILTLNGTASGQLNIASSGVLVGVFSSSGSGAHLVTATTGYTKPYDIDCSVLNLNTLSGGAVNIGGNSTWLGLNTGIPNLPTAVFYHNLANVTNGNAIQTGSFAQAPGQLDGYAYYQDTPANGDAFNYGALPLLAGIYRVQFLGVVGPNRGKIDWTLSGSPVFMAQDWYAAAYGVNNTFSTTFTVPSDGAYTLQGTVNGQHAGSMGYYMALTRVTIQKIA